MNLRTAVTETLALWKQNLYVKYARLHPKYEVLDIGDDPLVLPPIDATELQDDLEASFRDCMENESPETELTYEDGLVTKAAQNGCILLADEVNQMPDRHAPVEMQDDTIIDRSRSM